MTPHQMTPHQILAEMDHLRRELALAANNIISAAEDGLLAGRFPPLDADVINAVFYRILENCSFQDLADQRIERLLTALTGRQAVNQADAALMNGPALAGQAGLDQAAADRLLG